MTKSPTPPQMGFVCAICGQSECDGHSVTLPARATSPQIVVTRQQARAAVEELANTRMDMPHERWSELSSTILQALAEPATGGALDGYRAAVSWISADSWDGCSECIDILKAARAADVDWDWAADHDRIATELKRIRHFYGSAAPSNPPAPSAPSWGYAETVGNLIAQLQTMDPTSAIGAGYFVTMPNGERKAKVRGLTISRERVDGSNIRTGDESVPYSHVAWAAQDERSNPPAPSDVKCTYCGDTGKIEDRVDGLITCPECGYTSAPSDACDALNTSDVVSHETAFAISKRRHEALSSNPAGEGGVRARALEEAARVAWNHTSVVWEAETEDQAHETALRLCKKRRAQWGDDDCDRDGSCSECQQEVAEEHETEASKIRRNTAKAIYAEINALALSTTPSNPPAPSNGVRDALKKCRAQFDFYVSAHMAKSPPDMDKAATNQEFVELCDVALSSDPAGEGGVR